MEYHSDAALEEQVREMIFHLNFTHIPSDQIRCVRSRGSKSKYTLARIHTLSKIFQKTFQTKPFYIIEVLSENFDPLPKEEKIKTLIHELLHIPRSFSGGFRHHRPHVNRKEVEKVYQQLVQISKSENAKRFSLLDGWKTIFAREE